ncbi:MAG: hypothetical protein AB7G44_07160 [Bacteroidia bacterium]
MKRQKRYFLSVNIYFHPRDWKVMPFDNFGQSVPFMTQWIFLGISLCCIPDTPDADAALMDTAMKMERTHNDD